MGNGINEKEILKTMLFITKACLEHVEDDKDLAAVVREMVFANDSKYDEQYFYAMEKAQELGYITGNVDLTTNKEMAVEEDTEETGLVIGLCTLENIEITEAGEKFMTESKGENAFKNLMETAKPIINKVKDAAISVAVDVIIKKALGIY